MVVERDIADDGRRIITECGSSKAVWAIIVNHYCMMRGAGGQRIPLALPGSPGRGPIFYPADTEIQDPKPATKGQAPASTRGRGRDEDCSSPPHRSRRALLTHRAQTSSAMAWTPASISAGSVRSRSKVVSEPDDFRGRSATTGRSSSPFALGIGPRQSAKGLCVARRYTGAKHVKQRTIHSGLRRPRRSEAGKLDGPLNFTPGQLGRMAPLSTQ
jgi:hypothetical protein